MNRISFGKGLGWAKKFSSTHGKDIVLRYAIFMDKSTHSRDRVWRYKNMKVDKDQCYIYI